MKNILASLMLGLAATVVATPCIAAESAGSPREAEVAATMSTSFSENISEGHDGAFYLTDALKSDLWKISKDGTAEKLAHLENYPAILGVAALEDSIVISAIRRDFRTPNGLDFSDVGAEIVVLDRNGKVVASVAGQQGALFNGMVRDGRGKILLTDSRHGTVMQFDPETRTLSEWFKDEALAPVKVLGANGLKVAGDWVYIGNRDKTSIFRIRRDAAGRPQGPLTLVTDAVPNVDDFAVAPDGTVYLPPRDPQAPSPMMRITPDGEMTEYVVGPYSPSAVVSRDGQWVYWATSVPLGTESTEPQRLLRVALP